jgi:hypothetical protein
MLSRLVLLKKIQENGERAEIQASMNRTVRWIVNCCWATNPDDSLTLDEVDALFERMEYKLTPQVVIGRVRTFVTSLSQ